MPTLGAQSVNGRPQNETDGFSAEVSHALRTGRRWVSGPHCDWRWNMGFSPPSWIQATVTAMAPYAFPQNQKIRNFNFNEEKSWRPFSVTEKTFSWSTSCLMAQQSMPLHIVTTWHDFDEPFKRKGGECCHAACACVTITRGPIPRTSPLRFWKNLSGKFGPSSPDLAPSDFHLFLHLKKHLAGKKFDDNDVQEEVMCFKGLAADFYDSGIQKLVQRLNKCLGQCRRLCWKIRLCKGNSFTVSLL